MAVAFTRISYWLWGGTDHEAQNNSSLSPPDFPSGFREPDSLKFPSVNGSKMRSSSRRIKRKWHSREERRIDREYDIVLVPSDGGCMSGSESDDSDWSIGWLEPHAPDFQSESETENSFAVLVPCYGRGRCEQPERLKTHVLGAGDLMDGKEWCFHSVACNVYLEQLSRSVVNGVTPQLKLLFPLVINLNTKGQKEEDSSY
ncbi:uncharacterized protein [Elaeis guineensis]|uniref:Uncharacterized protein LOC105039185 isoform X2 n=1 Tax=Elaeis guineensis var. tenera TaxID=51953 RepID=A0A8N4EVB9_ELAGV|nr:uncharacterized protein LOC105039185 isoform X2 [Elaeis guineensis]